MVVTRADALPRFEDYVTARGAELLRLAWYLTGDGERARRMLARALGRSLGQWGHLSEEEIGAFERTLRRRLVASYLSLQRPGRPGRHEPTPVGLWADLERLPRRDRAALILRLVEDLSPARTADLLDTSVSAVESRTAHAVHTLGGSEASLRVSLAPLVPGDLVTDGLAAEARAYAGRGRHVRQVVSSVGAAAVVVVAALVAAMGQEHGLPPQPAPTTSSRPHLACGAHADPEVLTAPVERLSGSALQVLVCARIDPDSVWQGSLPPDDPVEEPGPLDAVTLDPRTDGRGCPRLPEGPSFRLLVLGTDLKIRSYANEGMACNGWPVLARYYVALAEQQVARVGVAGGFLGCAPILPHVRADGTLTSRRRPTTPDLPRGTEFTQATACLHPLSGGSEVPRYREVRSNVLGVPQLSQLNADARARGSAPGRLPSCPGSASLVVVRGLTRSGRLIELSSACGRTAAVDWSAQDVWTVSAATASSLRSLLVTE